MQREIERAKEIGLKEEKDEGSDKERKWRRWRTRMILCRHEAIRRRDAYDMS